MVKLMFKVRSEGCSCRLGTGPRLGGDRESLSSRLQTAALVCGSRLETRQESLFRLPLPSTSKHRGSSKIVPHIATVQTQRRTHRGHEAMMYCDGFIYNRKEHLRQGQGKGNARRSAVSCLLPLDRHTATNGPRRVLDQQHSISSVCFFDMAYLSWFGYPECPHPKCFRSSSANQADT